MVAVRKTRLQELTVDGRRGAKALAALRDNPERFLATVQVGITVIVGDIFSEHAKKVPQLIQVEVGGTAPVRGATPISELNRALGLELPEENGYTTIAGLSLALTGKVPSKGMRRRGADGLMPSQPPLHQRTAPLSMRLSNRAVLR